MLSFDIAHCLILSQNFENIKSFISRQGTFKHSINTYSFDLRQIFTASTLIHDSQKYNSIQLKPLFNERFYWFSLGGRSESPPSVRKLLFLCSFGIVLPCYISWLCLAWQKSDFYDFERNSLYQLQFHWSLSLRIKLITLAKIDNAHALLILICYISLTVRSYSLSMTAILACVL